MKNVFLILFFGLLFSQVNAQIVKPDRSTSNTYRTDSTRNKKSTRVKIDGVTKYTDYKIISIDNDTTIIDTILTIEKDYKMNLLRKDNFELMSFHNQGQTFTTLGYNFQGTSMFPAMGFNAKQFNYYALSDIYYYNVPTPTTELVYRKGIQQGQFLDALLTANTSRQFNISVAYKGMRSLGNYQNTLANQGNFRVSFSYNNENKSYYLRGNIYTYNFYNDQNGGLTPQSIIDFEQDNPDYTDRSRLEVNFNDANNTFEGKRYYLEHSITLLTNQKPVKHKVVQNKKPVQIDTLQRRNSRFSKIDAINRDNELISPDTLQQKPVFIKDSINNQQPTTIIDSTAVVDSSAFEKPSLKKDSISISKNKPLFDLKLGNSLLYETKHYRFYQSAANSYFGDAFVYEINDHTSYQKFNGQIYLQLNSAYVGSLKFKINYFDYNYHYNSVLYYDDYTISSKIKGNSIAIGADWNKKLGNIYFKADASTMLTGDLTGSTIKTAIKYQKDGIFNVEGFAEFTSKAPQFSARLYQSSYINFNWDNNLKNEDLTSFGGAINTKKWGSVSASYNVIDNYTYFNEESKPEQANETLNYFKIKLNNSFSYKKFSLANTIQYQNTLSGDSFFRVPSWITRNTVYFSTDVFKGDPLFLQTGITFKYFSSYKMNAYNPLISEFYLQNTTEIGNYPLLDFFLNLRIQRTRIFIKVENISAGFTGRNYFSAPANPYRDVTFRLGLVWNFFI